MCHGDCGRGVSQGRKVHGKMRRKEEGGGGVCLLSLVARKEEGGRAGADRERSNFHWVSFRFAVVKQEVALGVLKRTKTSL